VPADKPVTNPPVFIVATEVAELLQVPPVVPSDKVVVAPMQMAVVPLIAGAALPTVTVVVLLVVPHPPVAV